MSDAKKQQTRVDFDVKTKTGADAIFRANGSVITFAGFLAAYEDIVEDKSDVEDTDRRLPAMSVGDKNGKGRTKKNPQKKHENWWIEND